MKTILGASSVRIYFICIYLDLCKQKNLRACQPDLTHIKLLENNKKGSQPYLVRAEFHLAQHPTPSSMNLIKQMHLTMSWRSAIPGLHWEADNPSGKTLAATPSAAQLKKAGLKPLKAPYHCAVPLHCTSRTIALHFPYALRTADLHFCPTALKHGTIPPTAESGPNNFYSFCSARSASVELSCGQTRVQIHQLPLGMSWHSAKPKAICQRALQCWCMLKPICTVV